MRPGGAPHALSCWEHFTRCVQQVHTPMFNHQLLVGSHLILLFRSHHVQIPWSENIWARGYNSNCPGFCMIQTLCSLAADTCNTAIRAINHHGIHSRANSFWFLLNYLHNITRWWHLAHKTPLTGVMCCLKLTLCTCFLFSFCRTWGAMQMVDSSEEIIVIAVNFDDCYQTHHTAYDTQ